MKFRKNCWSAFAGPQDSMWYVNSVLVGIVIALAVSACEPRVARAAVHASIVIDAQTGAVLLSHNADKKAHPASLAKLMTLYITFQELNSGKLKLSQKLHVSRYAAAQEPTKLWLRPGSFISVRSAILGIVTKSANDAAVVLAEGISGSELRFARLMTQTAQELGMKRTVFYNATGLPSALQWTTARDMSNLALALINDFDSYYYFFGVRSFRFKGHLVYGHNHLLDRYDGADGLKTGYIRSSGYNLVTSAVRHQRRLVGVIIGGTSAKARDRSMMTLLDRGFKRPSSLVLAAGAKAEPLMPRRKATVVRIARNIERDEAAETGVGRNWIVQVGGSFSSEQSVRRILKSATLTAPNSLGTGRDLVVKLRGRHYRARFSHLSESMAIAACRTLRRKKFACRILDMHTPSNNRQEAALSPASQEN